MKARVLWLTIAAAAGILSYLLYPKPATTVGGVPALLSDDPVAEKCTVPACDKPAAAASSPPVSTPARKSLAEILPKTEDVRAAIAENPHTTPELLLKFSVKLYEREQEAAKSEGAATSFFGELQNCALEKNTVESVQAYCLLNAKRLAHSYPALQNDYHRLESQSDPRALSLMKDLSL